MKYLFSNSFFGEILNHILCNKKHFIVDINKKNMDENTFNSYFKKHDLFYDYDSVYDFEKKADILLTKKNMNSKFMERMI